MTNIIHYCNNQKEGFQVVTLVVAHLTSFFKFSLDSKGLFRCFGAVCTSIFRVNECGIQHNLKKFICFCTLTDFEVKLQCNGTKLFIRPYLTMRVLLHLLHEPKVQYSNFGPSLTAASISVT